MQVAYILSEDLAKATSQTTLAITQLILNKQVSSLLPSNPQRSMMVHSLARALGLISPEKHATRMPYVVKPPPAAINDLLAYHDRDYIEFILEKSPGEMTPEEMMSFGLEDDCPAFVGLNAYVRLVAGASLTAAAALKDSQTQFAICWDGGRHHAEKGGAAGYCYVADVVLSILLLRRASISRAPSVASLSNESPLQPPKRPHVLYLDLDLHHGNGVAHAFRSSSSAASTAPQVLTLSIHHTSPGFFPSSEHATLTSPDTPDPYTLSIPLAHGASAKTFAEIWSSVEGIKDAYRPDYIVVQCGVDGLAGDPCGVWNWCIDVQIEGSLGWCIQRLIGWGIKGLFLGGGGYNSPNAARAWAYLTSIICNNALSSLTPIPHHPSFPEYAPSFVLEIPPGNMPDLNTEAHIANVKDTFSVLAERIRQGRPAA